MTPHVTLEVPEDVLQRLNHIAEAEGKTPQILLSEWVQAKEHEQRLRAIRLRAYERARIYWRENNQMERAALTEEDMDDQFAFIGQDGIPRLKSDLAPGEINNSPLLKMAQDAVDLGLSDLSENFDAYLRQSFASSASKEQDEQP